MDLALQGQKHTPGVEITDDNLHIKMGHIIPHPMVPEHYISSIDILMMGAAGLLRVKEILLKPGDPNEKDVDISGFKPGVYRVQARCNLHGTWENEFIIG